MNRYETLQSIERITADSCPVTIVTGLLLRDTSSNSVLLQLKLQNTGTQSLRSVILGIQGVDNNGDEVGTIPEAVYRDVHATPGAFFGDRKAISLPDSATVDVEISIRAVSFEDGTLWVSPDADENASVGENNGLLSKIRTGAETIKTRATGSGKHSRKAARAESEPVSGFTILRLSLLGLLIVVLTITALYLFSLHQSKTSSDSSSADSTVQGVSLSDISAARYDNMVTGYWATEVVSVNGTSYTDATTCSVFSAHLISGGTGFVEMNGVKYELRWGYYSTQDNMIYYSASMNGEKCVMGYSTDRDSSYYHHLIITFDEDTSLVMYKS